MRKIKTTVQSF
jgi:hypothetical protein